MASMEDSYRNPFSDYNANTIESSKILEYWCSPFNFIKSTDISEAGIFNEGMPIVFMGGRGTGKTMFLKYCSYEVQAKQAEIDKNKGTANSLLDYFKNKKGIGFYVRIDGPVLRSFEGKGLSIEKWDGIFTHYFELKICKEYIEVIKDLCNKKALDEITVNNTFVPAVLKCLGEEIDKERNIDDVLEIINDKIQEVTSFRGNIPFSNIDFKPSKGFASQELSYGIVEIVKRTIKDFEKNVNFILFIDEYENFLEQQQKTINTLIRFLKPGITFRIGMRLEGFHTYDTISSNEFIKEGRDYKKIVFEDILIRDTNYQEFIKIVAKKRLESVKIFKDRNITDISCLLGNKENLEEEAKGLIKDKKHSEKHFDIIKSKNYMQKKEDIVEYLKCPSNPLIEMLNILMVLRGKQPKKVNEIMNSYLQGEHSPETEKYRMDYVDKYKLSLMFLLASVYRKNKKYYSFNTFCYLSSGIVGNFIELCRKCFQIAYFEDKDLLIEKGIISINVQSEAARDVADSELRMITRIKSYGDKLYKMTKNLGNIFRYYHADDKLRYPEVNQFSIDITSISNEDLRNCFRAGLEWSIIQKKIGLQATAPGSSKKEIYIINRIYSPIFEISYRTRGQYSKEINEVFLDSLMKEEDIKPSPRLQHVSRAQDPRQQEFSFEVNRTKESDV